MDHKRCMDQAGRNVAVVRWLCKPEAYPHGPDRVEHLETHISHVFLAGSYVYKLKKPVKFDFLDFATVEAREKACREEVRLNRRLAAETYLGALPVIEAPDGTCHWSGAGEIVEWVVQMRRLPTELTLDSLHRQGQLLPGHVDRLAKTLVGFYRSLTPLAMTAEYHLERYRAHVLGNLRELLAASHHLPRGVVARIHGFQLQLLRLQAIIFAERVERGRIVDGHGDLRPEHICFSDPITIFDCIEFNAEFRRLDIADELAFLAAECDFLGAPWVGPRLLQAYQEQSGDRPAAILLDFYKSYRACVRAKVAALRADQLAGEAQQAAAKEAGQHLSWADRYAAPWVRPLILVMGGAAGTGKTTLAKAVAEALGAEVLRTDVLRHEVFGGERRTAEADAGAYSPQARERIYEALFQRAAELLDDRISVVLDGTFSTAGALQSARQLSSAPESCFLAVECVCRREVARARIGNRLAVGRDASEARPEIHDLQRDRWQSWPAEIPQLRVDTEQPLRSQIEQVLMALTRNCYG